MLYTEDFTMRHYVGFSQIGSHMCLTTITVTSTWILISAFTIVCVYAKHAINSQNFKFKGVRNDYYYKKDIASYFINV